MESICSIRKSVFIFIVACLFIASGAAASTWRNIIFNNTLENTKLRAKFQAGNLYELTDLVTSQTLIYKDPASLSSILWLFGQSSVNLDTATVNQSGTSTSVQTIYTWPDGTSWTITWSVAGDDLVLNTSAHKPTAVDGIYITLTGCNMTAHNVTAIDGYGQCHTMTAPYTGALLAAHGGTDKNGMPWSFCQPMVVLFEGSSTGWVVEGRDLNIGPANLRPFGEGNTADLVASRAFPLTLATQDPQLFEVRIRRYSGRWQSAVDPYINWMISDVGFVPLSQKSKTWIRSIVNQTYLGVGNYAALADFDARYDATKTYLGRQAEYRSYRFDDGYPDYTPTAPAANWISYARSLGFHVGVHTNIAAIDRDNTALIELMEPGLLQIGTDENGDPIWAGSATHVYCSPAYPPWRAYFIDAIADVVAAGADVIYLDEAGPLGKFVIDGVTATQGVMIMEQEIMNAYPAVVLQTEGMNPCISRHAYFALIQHPPVHKLSGYILGTFIKLAPEGYMYSPIKLQDWDDYAYSGYILPGSDTSRSESWLEILDVFQQYNLVPNSLLTLGSNQFSGFSGSSQVEAYFEKTSTTRYLMVYRPYHAPEQHGVRYTNITQWSGPGYIENWLIFNGSTIYGLDPANTYWFDPAVTLDPTKFHITSIPGDYLPYDDDSRRIYSQETGFNEDSYRVFFSGNGQLAMYVPDEYNVYLDSQAVTIDRQTDTATVAVSATQQDPSIVRAFKRSEQVLDGYLASLNWTTPPQKWGWFNVAGSLYPPNSFYTLVPGEGYIFGRFPYGTNITLQGSWKERDDSPFYAADGVITINGSEVVRIPAGSGPPYSAVPFTVDITAFAGQYAMLELYADAHMTGSDSADWIDLQIIVTGGYPADCAAAIAQGFGLAADFNNDCYVNIQDLVRLAQDWLQCIEPTDPSCE